MTSGMTSYLRPDPFRGSYLEDPRAWLDAFQAYVTVAKITDADIPHVMRLLLKDAAITWFNSLAEEDKESLENLTAAFNEHFITSRPTWIAEQRLWSRSMSPHENLEDYIVDIDNKCARLNKADADRITVLVRGLPAHLKSLVISSQPKTWQEATNAARLALEAHTSAQNQGHVQSSSAQEALITLQASVKEQTELLSQLMTNLLKPQQATVNLAEASGHAADIICQLCGARGHAALSCSLYRQEAAPRRRRQAPRPRCDYCHRQGHEERECFTRMRDLQRQLDRQGNGLPSAPSATTGAPASQNSGNQQGPSP